MHSSIPEARAAQGPERAIPAARRSKEERKARQTLLLRYNRTEGTKQTLLTYKGYTVVQLVVMVMVAAAPATAPATAAAAATAIASATATATATAKALVMQ